MRIRPLPVIFGILWLVIGSAGLWIIFEYENTPSDMESAPLHWPVSSQIVVPSGRPVFLMFVHPQCPCTRASIEELDTLMASCQNRLETYLLFVRPKAFDVEWVRSNLWKQASGIPGVHLYRDDEGKEAKKFHATVSGQTLLYNEKGRLLFNGGITGSRGHSGDNKGRDSVISFVLKGNTKTNRAFVFGCSLFDPKKGTILKTLPAIANDLKG